MLLQNEQGSEADRDAEESLEGGDLEGAHRICVTNREEWDFEIVLNAIANDNNRFVCADDS